MSGGACPPPTAAAFHAEAALRQGRRPDPLRAARGRLLPERLRPRRRDPGALGARFSAAALETRLIPEAVGRPLRCSHRSLLRSFTVQRASPLMCAPMTWASPRAELEFEGHPRRVRRPRPGRSDQGAANRLDHLHGLETGEHVGPAQQANRIGARLHLVWRSLATGPPVASTRSSVSRANETSSELLKK